MAEEERSSVDRLAESTKEAISFKNIFRFIYRLFAFGILSAFPYIVKNLNDVGVKSATSAWYWKILAVLGALSKSIWIGFVYACNTIWDAFVVHGTFSWTHWGDILYFIIVIPGIFGVVYQPISILCNIFDFDKGKHYSFISALIISAFVMIAVIASVYYISDGATLTSKIEGNTTVDNSSISENLTDNSSNLTPEESTINSINMMLGGEPT